MPNQNISLNNYDPDAAKIQRQQQLAEMLQQQASEPIPVNGYNGIQAPISPLSILAKALQAYQGKRLTEKADTQYGDLQTKRRSELADMLSKQYQVPAQAAQGLPQTDTAPIQTQVSSGLPGAPSAPITLPGVQADPSLGAISNAMAARPTTPQEQLANSLSMMSSSNPQAAQMAPQLYQAALQKQQVNDIAGNGGPPPGVSPLAWKAALLEGDPGKIAALSQQGQQQLATQNTQPAAVKEYEYAKQQGFKGSLTDYQHTKAAATHITVGGAAGGADPETVMNWAKNVHSGLATINQVPMAIRSQVSNFLGGELDTKDSPIVAQRQTLASSRITAPYTKLSQYQLAADAQPYIQRMAAAAKHPGSIGDADLLDSLIKLNTGGNAITEAQASLVTGGRSFGDSVNVMSNKLKNGGVLSDSQRQQILAMGKEIASNYQKGLKPIYERATKQLKDANIPERYWTIPDINSFAELSGFGGGASGATNSHSSAKQPTVSNW